MALFNSFSEFLNKAIELQVSDGGEVYSLENFSSFSSFWSSDGTVALSCEP